MAEGIACTPKTTMIFFYLCGGFLIWWMLGTNMKHMSKITMIGQYMCQENLLDQKKSM